VHLQGTGTAHLQLATLSLVDPLLPSKMRSSVEITLRLEAQSLTPVRKGMSISTATFMVRMSKTGALLHKSFITAH